MQKGLILSFLAFVLSLSQLSAQEKFVFQKRIETGSPKAQPGDYVECHMYVFYRDSVIQGTRTHGAVPGTPAGFNLPSPDQMAAQKLENGLILAIMLMGVGDSISMFETIDEKTPPLPDFFRTEKAIRIDIKMLLIKRYDQILQEQMNRIANAEKMKERAPLLQQECQEFLKKRTEKQFGDALKKTESGLEYIITEQGTGPRVKNNEFIQIHYYGVRCNDGAHFDNSFARGEPIEIQVGIGQVILGWDEGCQLLNHGGKAWMYLPSKMGYGELGSGEQIPPNTDLLFYVEVQ